MRAQVVRVSRLLASALVALLCVAPTTHAAPGDPGEGRVVRAWDFDERRLGNVEEVPMHWAKVEGAGLPHYVKGRLDNTVGRSSRFSFRFDLNGGSIVYRYDPTLGGRIPVKTGALYRVEAFVRTTALENARARVTAYFVDRDYRKLPGSARHSPLFVSPPAGRETEAQRADRGWTPLTFSIPCSNPKAVYLVLELELLQPALYAPSSLGERTLFNQDVKGSAWFTDVSVSQVPEVAVTADSAGSIFPRGTPVRLWLKITDRQASDLSMRLEVRSADGTLVHQRTGDFGGNGASEIVTSEDGLEHRLAVSVPEVPAGWYLTEVVLTARGREVARERRSFIQLPDAGQAVSPDARFGVIATSLQPAQWQSLPALLPLLGSGRVKVAVWGENADIQKQDSQSFDRLLEKLQDTGVMPTAVITALPPEIASTVGSSSISRLPRVDPELWRPRLSYLIARHANHLDRWQLGTDGQDEFVTDPAFRRSYDLIYTAFQGLVHSPDVSIPWPGSVETDSKLPSTVAISLPASVLPDQVPLYIQDTKDRGGKRLSLTLLPLGSAYGREANLRDFAQRFVTAITGGADRIDLNLPFSDDGQPDELFLVQRTLQQALTGTIFRGRLALADHVDAYLFERSGKGVIVLWDKGTRPPSAPTDPPFDGSSSPGEVRINLGGRPRVVDLFGNVTPLRPTPTPPPRASDASASASANAAPPAPVLPSPGVPEPGSVGVPLGALPVIVEDVDPAMALFRVSVALDNPMLESAFAPHTRKITFTNTFPDFISGAVRLTAPKGWAVTPGVINFNLNPGETFTKEVQIEIPYNTLAGAKPLFFTFSIPGVRPSEFSLPVEMRLGLNEVGLQTLAVREGPDVVVQLMITNYGQKIINYNAFALFPGQARQERLVTGLAPGRTTVKRFRFPTPPPAAEGAKPPARKIRVGIREVEGTRILNDEVVIP